MCQTCGCSTGHKGHGHGHHHDHGEDHDHTHGHGHHHHEHDTEHRAIEVNTALLGQNDKLAERNRGIFLARGIAVLNLVSSPGSGKTMLLEKTLQLFGKEMKLAVIVGDLATENDAMRLRRHGSPAIQIQTGTVCHLDAHMIHHAIEDLKLSELDILFIENVGNLVCPSAFDLGEDARIVLTSVTEGEDKPLKYPSIFQDAELVLLNKTDLSAAVEFDREAALRNIREAAPGAKILEISAKTGDGLSGWFEYLRQLSRRKKSAMPK